MRVFSRLLLPALAAAASTLAFAAPAAAAAFTCSASTVVNDVGPLSQVTQAAPCDISLGAVAGNAYAATSASAGLLRAGTQAHTGSLETAGSAGGNAYASAFDQLVVSGLGDAGAVLRFNVNVEGLLLAGVSGPRTLGGDPSATSSFNALVNLSTDGRGGQDSLNGCVTPVPSGVSVCNGVFDFGPSLAEVVNGVLTTSLFLNNGDILNIFMSLQTFTGTRIVSELQTAGSSADFGHTLYWDGLVFDEASRNVRLTSATTGFDYRYSALPTMGGVPEPGAWAMMILGFGLAGGALRRRRPAFA